MKTLTRLCLVFVMVAVASTMVYAGRPQCSDITRPQGVCFWDDSEYFPGGNAAWLGFMMEDAGLAYVVIYESNDFCSVMPDGGWFCQATDARVTLYVCPDRGWACLVDWLTREVPEGEVYPAPLEEMYVGEGRWTRALRIDADFSAQCPDTANIRGQVMDAYGQRYLFTGAHNVRKDGDTCRVMKGGLELEAM